MMRSIPYIWRKRIVIPIFKNKGDITWTGKTNYRGIKLMCHSMKQYEIINDTRLRNMVSITYEEQFVFVKGKPTTDSMCSSKTAAIQTQQRTTRLTLCAHWSGKSIWQSPLGRTAFVHKRQVVKGVMEKYIILEKDIYHQCEAVVRRAAITREHFPVPWWCIHWRKHQKRSTLADDVRGWCGAVRKG